MYLKKWFGSFLFVCLAGLIITTPLVNASSKFKPGPEIPGIKNSGWVPQGLSYLKSENWILHSYYWDQGKGSEGHASVIAVFFKSGQYKMINLYENHTHKHYGHVGGITVSSNYLWVASTERSHNYLLQYSLQALIHVKNKGKLVPKKMYGLAHGTSYVTYHQPSKLLCIGKWVPKIKGSHGLLYCHKLNDKEDLSSDSKEYQTPSDIQGIEFYGNGSIEKNYILFSQSFGRKKDSKLLIYKGLGTETKKVTQFTINPMSEDMVKIGNKIYISFESGAKKYHHNGKKQTYNLYYAEIANLLN
ncbi:hypothetical protein MK805_11420 [Shimazuella sp. AN120528]|uniref:hypothetical protein n=1 Tax=Shimazuella soli TaxID=1892854 RepID=UPI001F1020D1|nr:hypothetical protein [Shimazuella soli]MCH5585558.1 hypothetical protein [Shimazuella soli]